MERVQKELILRDLEKKMVFVVGPRQVGKTWLSLEISKHFTSPLYLNYDDFDDRGIIINRSWRTGTDLIIFDELHKMEKWKNYLKGLFDTKRADLRILVTGSARLATFRQSGDSLAGRFFAHRLHPFTLSDIPSPTEGNLNDLLQKGGFPEPFLAENFDDANRWRRQYVDGLIRTDILDFEKIHDFKAIQLVFNLLQRRTGSPISLSSIAEDVHVSPVTVKKYIDIFEALYIVFRVRPFSKNIARSILKEPKIYFFDTGLVKGDEGVVFENLIALELLKAQNTIADYKGLETGLFYLRTKDKKEVDFCLVQDDEIKSIIEVKLNDRKISKNLKYFSESYNLKAIQLVKDLRNEYTSQNIEVRKALNYFAG